MPYWGKIIGTMAGLATGRPWLALLGLILGHQFDRGFARRFSYFDARLDRVPDGFVKALFQTMGHLAKADGRVTEDEIRAARVCMHRLGLGPAQIRQAIDWFENGKQQGFPLIATVRQLRRASSRRVDTRGLFLQLLMEVSLAKDGLHRRERSIYWTICTELDIGRVELAQLEAMIRAQRGFRRSAQGTADARRVSGAYRALGVSESSTNAEIKKAYRRLMNKNHPDKLASSNPDDAAIAEAERRTREIRSAYEMLKTRRSIR
ncbi:MAG: co-chaperone DjlA [Woeseiaceae bacterium]